METAWCMPPALETEIRHTAFKPCFQCPLVALQPGNNFFVTPSDSVAGAYALGGLITQEARLLDIDLSRANTL